MLIGNLEMCKHLGKEQQTQGVKENGEERVNNDLSTLAWHPVQLWSQDRRP
jgi:hypothetical protein